jgi:hypothetical protein
MSERKRYLLAKLGLLDAAIPRKAVPQPKVPCTPVATVARPTSPSILDLTGQDSEGSTMEPPELMERPKTPKDIMGYGLFFGLNGTLLLS